jgi:hypothetical protein
MFMDAIGMLLLTLPVVYPAVMALNGGEFVTAEDSTFGMSGTDVRDLVRDIWWSRWRSSV